MIKPLYFTAAVLSLLFSIGNLFSISAERTDRILLNNADTLNILLFEHHKPSEVMVYAREGHIRISNQADFSKLYTEKQAGVPFILNEGAVSFRDHKNVQKAQKWVISTDNTSLIRLKLKNAPYRYYRGTITITLSPNGNHLQIINQVSLENYVASVIGGEMDFEHPEALKAQAVISRTYALWHLNTNPDIPYNLTDHTMSQVYIGELIDKPRYLKAAMATHGEILTWSDKLILAVFSSTCGGRTADNETVWAGKAYPYLRSVHDNSACHISPHYHWQSTIKASELHELINNTYHIKADSLATGATDKYGRVSTMVAFKSNEKIMSIPANQFRLQILKHMDSEDMKSTFFTMNFSRNIYTFVGKGLGHGIGLCQWGALSFAQNGWNYKDILRFYYQGTEIKNLHFINAKTITKAQ